MNGTPKRHFPLPLIRASLSHRPRGGKVISMPHGTKGGVPRPRAQEMGVSLEEM